MGPVLIVQFQPAVQVDLELIERSVDLLSKCDSIEFIEHGLVKTFTDTVGLGTLGLGARVIDIFHRQVQLVLMTVGSTVLCPPVRQHSQ